MMQTLVHLAPKSRGFHLITDELLAAIPELSQIKTGIAHFFIQHSSASLTINENADPDVRGDMERYFLHSIPERATYFKHVVEGPDDMPAHIKASILGASLSVPVSNGRLLLGTWQGIWLGEHRINGGSRTVVISVY